MGEDDRPASDASIQRGKGGNVIFNSELACCPVAAVCCVVSRGTFCAELMGRAGVASFSTAEGGKTRQGYF
jgi:hypothetical protein